MARSQQIPGRHIRGAVTTVITLDAATYSRALIQRAARRDYYDHLLGIAMLDMLAANPYLTINHVAKQLGVAYTTAQRVVDRLVSTPSLKRSARLNATACTAP